jgi:SAM-dependent MidA family methyltransferase
VAPAADDVARAIAAAGGALRFDEFLDVALYGPSGFYTSGGGAGRRGDFLTSPETGPLFGVLVARMLDDWWVRLGEPSRFRMVEVGAGRGTLARAVLAARPRCSGALEYVAVERSPVLREQHPPGIVSVADLPENPVPGVVFANELLDNLPFRLFVWDGGWREAWVAHETGRFVEVLRSGASPFPLPADAALGSRVPVQERAVEFVARVGRLASPGAVVLIDYCSTDTASLAVRPWREWLRTYRRHERGGHYLADPGSQDVTCEVCFDQVLAGAPDAVVQRQQDWLRGLGIDELVDEGRRAWGAAAGAPDLQALAMRSRIPEAEALLDPAGLGGFSVVTIVN